MSNMRLVHMVKAVVFLLYFFITPFESLSERMFVDVEQQDTMKMQTRCVSNSIPIHLSPYNMWMDCVCSLIHSTVMSEPNQTFGCKSAKEVGCNHMLLGSHQAYLISMTEPYYEELVHISPELSRTASIKQVFVWNIVDLLTEKGSWFDVTPFGLSTLNVENSMLVISQNRNWWHGLVVKIMFDDFGPGNEDSKCVVAKFQNLGEPYPLDIKEWKKAFFENSMVKALKTVGRTGTSKTFDISDKTATILPKSSGKLSSTQKPSAVTPTSQTITMKTTKSTEIRTTTMLNTTNKAKESPAAIKTYPTTTIKIATKSSTTPPSPLPSKKIKNDEKATTAPKSNDKNKWGPSNITPQTRIISVKSTTPQMRTAIPTQATAAKRYRVTTEIQPKSPRIKILSALTPPSSAASTKVPLEKEDESSNLIVDWWNRLTFRVNKTPPPQKLVTMITTTAAAAPARTAAMSVGTQPIPLWMLTTPKDGVRQTTKTPTTPTPPSVETATTARVSTTTKGRSSTPPTVKTVATTTGSTATKGRAASVRATTTTRTTEETKKKAAASFESTTQAVLPASSTKETPKTLIRSHKTATEPETISPDPTQQPRTKKNNKSFADSTAAIATAKSIETVEAATESYEEAITCQFLPIVITTTTTTTNTTTIKLHETQTAVTTTIIKTMTNANGKQSVITSASSKTETRKTQSRQPADYD